MISHVIPVSYTHLDVYKRQDIPTIPSIFSETYFINFFNMIELQICVIKKPDAM